MRKILILHLFFGILVAALVSIPANGVAGVDVNIGINVPPPPRVVVHAPPAVVVIPGTYVYFPPTLEVDIFFYGGYWYRSHHGHWYRATSYDGHWVFIEKHRVPYVVLHVPPDFRRLPPGYRHIPYRELHKNWRTWERDKHWERYEAWHHRDADRHERKDHYDARKHEKGGGKGRR
ncbi:MAG: hypothetical protein ACE144_07205 [Thermodesulfobacteriota bacterium]